MYLHLQMIEMITGNLKAFKAAFQQPTPRNVTYVHKEAYICSCNNYNTNNNNNK